MEVQDQEEEEEEESHLTIQMTHIEEEAMMRIRIGRRRRRRRRKRKRGSAERKLLPLSNTKQSMILQVVTPSSREVDRCRTTQQTIPMDMLIHHHRTIGHHRLMIQMVRIGQAEEDGQILMEVLLEAHLEEVERDGIGTDTTPMAKQSTVS